MNHFDLLFQAKNRPKVRATTGRIWCCLMNQNKAFVQNAGAGGNCARGQKNRAPRRPQKAVRGSVWEQCGDGGERDGGAVRVSTEPYRLTAEIEIDK